MYCSTLCLTDSPFVANHNMCHMSCVMQKRASADQFAIGVKGTMIRKPREREQFSSSLWKKHDFFFDVYKHWLCYSKNLKMKKIKIKIKLNVCKQTFSVIFVRTLWASIPWRVCKANVLGYQPIHILQILFFLNTSALPMGFPPDSQA